MRGFEKTYGYILAGITCLKLTIETLEKAEACNFIKKETQAQASFWCLYC